MKKAVLILAAILMAACASAPSQEKTYSVYEYPDTKEKGTLPAYRVKEMPNGELRIYEPSDPFEYRYRVTPEGNIYKKGDPFQRLGEIKPADKKGE